MIAANELRIGNWVNVKVEGKDGLFDGNYQIEEIRKDVILFNNGIHAAYRMLYPIPLTKEILLKCNAKFRGIDCGWKYYDIEDLVISINAKDGRIFFSAFDRDSQGYVNDFDIELISLYQWQNIYFALKGKELEVKI